MCDICFHLNDHHKDLKEVTWMKMEDMLATKLNESPSKSFTTKTVQIKSITVFLFCHQMVLYKLAGTIHHILMGFSAFNVCINILQYRTLSVNRLGS